MEILLGKNLGVFIQMIRTRIICALDKDSLGFERQASMEILFGERKAMRKVRN